MTFHRDLGVLVKFVIIVILLILFMLACASQNIPERRETVSLPIENEVSPKLEEKTINLESQVAGDLNLGIFFFNNKNYGDAIDEFNKIINASPGNKVARKYLFHSYFWLGVQSFLQKYYIRAIYFFEEALKFNKDCKTCEENIKNTYKAYHYQQGLSHFQNNELIAAYKEMLFVHEIDPGYEEVRRYLKKLRSLINPGKKVFSGIRGLSPMQIPKFHFWSLITEMAREPVGFGLYTYVLFGRNVENQMDIKKNTLARYKSLLRAIRISTSNLESLPLRVEEANLFCIPATRAGPDHRPSIENYKSSLSMSYISAFVSVLENEPELIKRLTTRPGPFLISSTKSPSNFHGSNSPILYTDLSTINAAAMDEVVALYKARIMDKPIHDVEDFNPLRLRLLNVFLNFDDDLNLVKTVFAAGNSP